MALPLIPIGLMALTGGAGFLAGGALSDTFKTLFWLTIAVIVGYLLIKVM